MKFSAQFEFHKIPEWYSEYLDYKRFKGIIKAFKQQIKDGNVHKLRGLYNLTNKGCVIPMDIFDQEGKQKHENSNTITIRTSAQLHQKVSEAKEITMNNHPNHDQEALLMLTSQEIQLTEDDLEEVEYIKQKINDIVEGKEHFPIQYENTQRPRRDSLSRRQSQPDLDFRNPGERRNKSEYRKGENQRMLKDTKDDAVAHLYQNMEMPHLQKEDIRFLKIDLDDPQKRAKTELLMNNFVKSFLLELERIETTYKKFLKQYQDEFTMLKDRYIKKQNIEDIDSNLLIQNTQSLVSYSNQSGSHPEAEEGSIHEEKKQPLLDDPKKNKPSMNAENQAQSRPQRSSSIQVGRQRVEAQKITKVKDELEYATNWRRAFNKIFTHLKWLIAYAKINEIAFLNLIQKFMKHYFVLKDNIIDKKLIEIIKLQTFSSRKQVNRQINEVIDFFSENFTMGKRERAVDLLEKHNAPMRMKDVSLLSYFGGLLSMIILTLIIVGSLPFEREPELSSKEIFSCMPTFRFLLMILFTVASAGVAIKVLRRYKVNYIFIFQLDPHYKVTYLQLIRIALVMLTVWSFCLVGHIAVVKLKYIFTKPAAGFALAVLITFMGICFAPFHCFYKRARKELLVVLWHIVISPFGLVKFKHFFLADILTSFVVPLKDVGNMVCFFASKLWLDSIPSDPKLFPGLIYYLMIIPILPFWFRFAQCLVRYRETKLTANLINAGKYMSSLIVQVVGAIKTWRGTVDTPLWSTILAVSLISTLYCLYWDYKMDWGLFRETPGKGKKFLRDKLLYPAWFYYYAMISNTILRFFWILGLITFDNGYIDKQIIPLIQCLFEGFRRAQWALIRIENENVNNFERYRNILQIPAFKEDYEEEETEAPVK